MEITKTSMQKICLVMAGLNLAALVATGHSEHATGLNFLRPDGSEFLDKNGKKQGPKFPVCVYIFTPQGLRMPIRDIYHDFRIGFK